MWNDEANHFLRWSQVINNFVKRFGNGDFARWQIFGFRRGWKYPYEADGFSSKGLRLNFANGK